MLRLLVKQNKERHRRNWEKLLSCSGFKTIADDFHSYVYIYIYNLMKENSFKLAKERSKRYLAPTITNLDFAVIIALMANTPGKAESQLHSLERAVGGIGIHVNTEKTEYMYFNQRGDISTLNGGPLKLVDKFTYRGSSVSSTEDYINTRPAKS